MTGMFMPMPTCTHCGSEVAAINVNHHPDNPQAWFVFCGSDKCAERGLGRPLSDCFPTRELAEKNWRETPRPSTSRRN